MIRDGSEPERVVVRLDRLGRRLHVQEAASESEAPDDRREPQRYARAEVDEANGVERRTSRIPQYRD
jgi:hypothetical protein